MNCIGIFNSPFIINPSLLWESDLPLKYRWTWDWSVPKYDRNKNNAAVVPVQKLYRSSRLKSKFTRFSFSIFPATCKASINEIFAGSIFITKKPANIIPPIITAICCFWVWVTALVPPETVYIITKSPIKILVQVKFQLSKVDNIIAGA